MRIILLLYFIHHIYTSVCPFGLPPFTCKAPTEPVIRKPISQEQIQAILKDSSNSKMLNIAAPILQLLPKELGSLATFGDSISAGLFVTTTPGELFKPSALIEERMYSWSNGGAPLSRIITLYNTLQVLAPNIQGGSKGATKKMEDSNDYARIGFDMAISSQQSDNLMSQANKYINFLKERPDLVKEWKMANVLIGANDICRSCETALGANQTMAQKFESGIRNFLDKLQADPNTKSKTLINLFGISDLTAFRAVGDDVPSCMATRAIGNICPCVLKGEENQMGGLRDMIKSFNAILKRIALEYQKRYLESLLLPGVADTHKDAFLLYYQPAFEDLSVEDTGVSILSIIDCFHPNYCGHQALAFLAFLALFTDTEAEKRHAAHLISMISRASLVKAEDPSGKLVQSKKLKKKIEPLSSVNNTSLAWNCPKHDTFIR